MPIQTTYSTAKTQFAKFWNEVINNQEVVIISKRGTEDVAMISASELSELLEKSLSQRSSLNRKRLPQASRRTPVKKKTGLSETRVIGKDTEAGYREMAKDEVREAEASEWAEITIGDMADESW